MNTEPNPKALVGVSEIAEALGVSRQAVVNWKARDPTFPVPLQQLRMGPIWHMGPILKWWKRT